MAWLRPPVPFRATPPSAAALRSLESGAGAHPSPAGRCACARCPHRSRWHGRGGRGGARRSGWRSARSRQRVCILYAHGCMPARVCMRTQARAAGPEHHRGAAAALPTQHPTPAPARRCGSRTRGSRSRPRSTGSLDVRALTSWSRCKSVGSSWSQAELEALAEYDLFFDDVVPELERFGRVVVFRVGGLTAVALRQRRGVRGWTLDPTSPLS